MSFLSWLRNWMPTSTRERRRTHGAARKRASFRPRLEDLESRDVPSILTVTNTLDSGKGSLRYEIAQAEKSNGQDTVAFNIKKSDRGYNATTGAWTITLTSGELDITGSLKIQGPGAGRLTVSGGGNSRVFEVEQNVTAALSGLTISNGDGIANPMARMQSSYDGAGNGILNLGTLAVSDCMVSNNNFSQQLGPGEGGGIANFGTLTVSSSTLSGNVANVGGGIYNAGTLTVTGSTLSGNSVGGWGSPGAGCGICNVGTAMVSGSTLSSNGSGDGTFGGGIYNAGTLTVSSSTLVGNFIYYNGGGIYNVGTLTVTGSTFSGNSPNNIYGSYTDGGGNSFS
jgi:hypothetical protein